MERDSSLKNDGRGKHPTFRELERYAAGLTDSETKEYCAVDDTAPTF